ncbi:MAG: BamA/TamA family outer membrane protein [Bacteroidota bacterium]|nr:MAG: BamA/TamA family outer membrane protein [Bacteroidota bacterium]
MKIPIRFLFIPAIIMLNFFIAPPVKAQSTEVLPTDSLCPQRDLSDVVRELLDKPAKEKPSDQGSLLLLPIIQSNPATGFAFGVGGQYAFKVLHSNNYSLVMGSVQYTTKNQFIFMLKNNIYTKYDNFFLTGDWRYLIYSQSTYGLGTQAPEGGIIDYQYSLAGLETSPDSLAQPMKFNFIRLHQSLGYKIAQNIYVGLGYSYDSYSKLIDEKLSLNPGDSLITSHYAFNKKYGFDTEKYLVSALNASFVIDKRDNMIMAYKGYYLSLKYRGGFEFLGSDRTSNLLSVEWRSFHGLSKRDPSHLIAFWVLGDFSEEGALPYMVLPATAYDQRGRSSRGYTQGRFRGTNMVYAEAEYRFPISPCGGVLGGVLFVNATAANSPVLSVDLFDVIKPAAGFGLRIKADKNSRTNLAVDIGFGHQSAGFYLAASETF